jgi:hypothetical protein
MSLALVVSIGQTAAGALTSSAVVGTLFVDPMSLSRLQQMILLLPLCLTISIVYKTTKVESLRDLPLVVLVNWLTVIVGMYAVGAALLLLHYVAT